MHPALSTQRCFGGSKATYVVSSIYLSSGQFICAAVEARWKSQTVFYHAVSAHYTTTRSAIQVLSEHIASLLKILDAMDKGGLLGFPLAHPLPAADALILLTDCYEMAQILKHSMILCLVAEC